jgi:PPOX class probable F420-dependent enzyme
MNEDPARRFIASSHRGVLATMKRDGRPQMSNMAYLLDDDGRIKMSTRGPNVKVRNIRRDPRVTVAIQGETFADYLVVDGTAKIVDENPIPLLKKIYEGIRGQPHPNWQEFEAAQRDEQRVVIDIEIEHMYPVARLARAR